MSAPEAGRDLDALIAEKLMDWTRDIGTGDNPIGFRPAFSTDIAAAWTVVEKLRGMGLVVEIMLDPEGADARVELWGRSPIGTEARVACEFAPTVPLAICRAALLAVEAHA